MALPTLVALSILFVARGVLSTPISDGDLRDFWAWCENRGIFSSDEVAFSIKLYGSISGHEGQRIGIVAEKDIPDGMTLFRVPNDSFVSSSNLANLPNLPFPSPTEDLDTWLAHLDLAAWILREKSKSKSSEWEPYIRILPDYIGLPLNFPDALLKELQSEKQIHEVASTLAVLKSAYDQANKTLLADASFEEFLWAFGVVQSRAFSGSNMGEPLIVPVADLFNHAIYHQLTWLHNSENFTMAVMADTPKGEQLWNNYGKLSNTDLLLHYGFVMEDNIYEHIPLFPSLDEVVAFYLGNLAHPDFSRADEAWAEYVAQNVIDTINGFEDEEWSVISGTEYSLWLDGRVEVRLLAALAAMAYYGIEGAEPKNYTRLALHSQKLGSPDKEDWAFIEGVEDVEFSSLRLAVLALTTKLSELVGEFETSIDEDYESLMSCGGGKEGPEAVSCSPLWENFPGEMKLCVLYRYIRKSMITAALERYGGEWDEFMRDEFLRQNDPGLFHDEEGTASEVEFGAAMDEAAYDDGALEDLLAASDGSETADKEEGFRYGEEFFMEESEFEGEEGMEDSEFEELEEDSGQDHDEL